MSQRYRRTVEGAKTMLLHAKQKEDEVNPITQVFYHPTHAECVEAKENLEEEFIQKLKDGERLIFKGCHDEKIVLCTESETYEVKEGEISNSLILCPNLLYSANVKSVNENERILKEQMVCGIYNNYLELRLIFPRLNKLRLLLAGTAYHGPSKEEDSHKGYDFSELIDTTKGVT